MSDSSLAIVLFLSIEPNTTADQEKLSVGIQRLVVEDPTLRVQTNHQTGQTIIGATGERHLEIIVERLKREFGVEASVGKPQVAYKEAFTRASEGEGRYFHEAGGHRQYAHAKIRLSPGEPGSGYIFEHAIGVGSIPAKYITQIDEGIKDALTHGVLAGYPVDNVKIELHDGSFHDADSSELAFRIAGAMAFQDAATKAKPLLLEPVMRVEIAVSKDYIGDVMGDLASRRGHIQSHEERSATHILSARVPLSEMFGYATDLRSRTRGRATCSMRFDRYEPRSSDTEGTDDSMVRAPMRPVRPSRDSQVALPEPDTSGGDGVN